MQPLPSRWATDLAVVQLFGSTIEQHPDHLVVRTTANPDFHWGNFILVTAADQVADADRWLEVFSQTHLQADWVAIGLLTPPTDLSSWSAHALDVEVDQTLSTGSCPRGARLADGYQVRRLVGTDWDRLAEQELGDNEASDTYDAAAHERFIRTRNQQLAEASARDALAYFGAFDGDTLAASLGIVVCDGIARYQAVGTHSAHRRRGLAGHLLGVAARWASDQQCDRWVIVTETTNPAGRLYRSVGFEPDLDTASVYLAPPR